MKRYLLWSLLVVVFFVLVTPQVAEAKDARRALLQRFLQRKPVPRAPLVKMFLRKKLPLSLVRRFHASSLRILRNTIFALQGRKFRTPFLQKFFGHQPWYKPQASARIRLSSAAKANVKLLLKAEKIARVFGLLWGEWPQKMLPGKKGVSCLIYRRYEVLQKSSSIQIKKRGNARCRITRANLLFKIRRKGDMPFAFQGLYLNYVFTKALGSSDMQSVKIYSLDTKEVVFRRDSLPAGATFEVKGHWFLFSQGLAFPKSCKRGMTGYPKEEVACWKILQKKHKALRQTPAPGCKCGGGLGPYVLAQYALSLTNPQTSPRLTGKVSCGCSS